jgi:hypothetical protein
VSYIERHPTRKAWRVRWRSGGRGTPQKASEWFDAKSDAEAAQAVIDGRKQASKDLNKRTLLTLSEIVERWAKKKREKGKSKRYVDESAERLHLLFREREWKRLSDVSDTDSLPAGLYVLLRALLQFAHRHLGQPLPNLLPPDSPKRRPAHDLLTKEQVDELIRRAGEWCADTAAISHLVAVYGHRPQSLVGLSCRALRNGRLSLPVKSGDDVQHPLLPETVEMLEKVIKARKKDEPMFLDHEGEKWKDGHAFSSWWFHRVGDHRIGIYQLKRYALTRMLSVGLDVATIASITGHRTPQTILRYARTNQDRQREAIAAIAELSAPLVHPEK